MNSSPNKPQATRDTEHHQHTLGKKRTERSPMRSVPRRSVEARSLPGLALTAPKSSPCDATGSGPCIGLGHAEARPKGCECDRNGIGAGLEGAIRDARARRSPLPGVVEREGRVIEPISRVEDGLILFQPVENIPKQDADLPQGQITIRPGLQLPNRLSDQTKQALQ